MKKLALLIVGVLLFSLTACGGEVSSSSDISSSSSEISTPTNEQSGEIIHNSITVVTDGVGNFGIEISDETANDISTILEGYEFVESSSDCIYDYNINLGGRNLLYHSECGILTEFTFTENSVCALPSCMKENICKLGNNDREILNQIIRDVVLKNSENDKAITAKIVKKTHTYLLVADDENNASDLITVPCDNTDNFNNGDTVYIIFDGDYMETYPAQINKPEQILLISRGADTVGLYLDVIADIMAHDQALNENIELIALDLDDAQNLNSAEKSALAHLVWEQQDVECISLTREQLEKDGYIKEGHFEKGVLLSVSNFEYAVCKPNFEFNLCKYKAPLAAYIFTDILVTMSEDLGTYQYEIGAHAIS